MNTDTALLYPPFAYKVLRLMCEYNVEFPDEYLHVLEGYRSPKRQALLYRQGRTTPGRKVTDASAWESWHQYGLAVDLVVDKDVRTPGRQRPYEADWGLVGHLAKKLDLEWGGDFARADKGHIQMSNGLDIKEVSRVNTSTGLLEVWKMVGSQ